MVGYVLSQNIILSLNINIRLTNHVKIYKFASMRLSYICGCVWIIQPTMVGCLDTAFIFSSILRTYNYCLKYEIKNKQNKLCNAAGQVTRLTLLLICSNFIGLGSVSTVPTNSVSSWPPNITVTWTYNKKRKYFFPSWFIYYSRRTEKS